jgi:hypothetical protein
MRKKKEKKPPEAIGPHPLNLGVERGKGTEVMAGALVAGGVSVEVLLVVLLGGPPLASRSDLGDDGVLPPLLIGEVGDLAGSLFLVVGVVVDGGAVLGAGVGALAVQAGGVVEAVEELEELAVGHLVRVIDDLRGLGMASLAAADGAVRRVVEVAANVADLAVEQALAGKVLAVEGLGAPEAAGGDGAALGAVGDRARSEGGGHWGGGGVGEGADEAAEQGHQGDGEGEDEERGVGEEG